MNEHRLRSDGDQALQSQTRRLLACPAPGNRIQQIQPSERRSAVLAVFGTDHDTHAVDIGVIDEVAYGMAQDGVAEKRQVLLGKRGAETRTAPAGKDQGDAPRHIVPVRLFARP